MRLTKTLTLHVTAERIARGRPGAGACPIAVTLQDRGFGAGIGTTGLGVVSISPGVFAHYKLPRVARELVRRFDAGQRVAPASFRITRTT